MALAEKRHDHRRGDLRRPGGGGPRERRGLSEKQGRLPPEARGARPRARVRLLRGLPEGVHRPPPRLELPRPGLRPRPGGDPGGG